MQSEVKGMMNIQINTLSVACGSNCCVVYVTVVRIFVYYCVSDHLAKLFFDFYRFSIHMKNQATFTVFCIINLHFVPHFPQMTGHSWTCKKDDSLQRVLLVQCDFYFYLRPHCLARDTVYHSVLLFLESSPSIVSMMNI
jgi:hypothetical protein